MRTEAAAVDRYRESVKKFVTFGLCSERYGIDVGKAKEILARYEIVPLPKTPEFIEGIISLRGDIIPIVDLRKRFSLPSKDKDNETRIIVLELKDFTVGIQVDTVFEVLKLAEDEVEPPPPLVAGLKAEYLEGVAEVEGRLTTILNLDEIFSSTERIELTDIELDEELAEGALEETAGDPEAAAKGEVCEKIVVTDDGMAEFRGKSYFIGKRHKGCKVEICETGDKLKVSKNGKKIKELKL